VVRKRVPAIAVQDRVKVSHEFLKPYSRGGPLGLPGGEMVRGFTYLLDSDLDLVGCRLLLLGGEGGFLDLRDGRLHQLSYFLSLPGALLGRHDSRVRLLLDSGNDGGDGGGGLA
jgi:hypothetical protein